MRGFTTFFGMMALVAVCERPVFADSDRIASSAKSWGDVPFLTSKASARSDIKVKIRVVDGVARVLVSFPSPSESRRHRPWRWQADRGVYVPDETLEEDAVFLVWRSDSGGMADVWFWGAARTDPSGFADDFHLRLGARSIVADVLAGEMEPDVGTRCWLSRFPSGFAGESVPRFYQRTPSDGQRDVRAKGVWDDGRWTIEFERKLDSDDPNDLRFEGRGGRLTLIVPRTGDGDVWVAEFAPIAWEDE